MFTKKKNILVGKQPIIEALKGTADIEKILIEKNVQNAGIEELITLAKQKNIFIQWVPSQKLNRITNVRHQGVLAFKQSVAYYDLQQVIDWVNEKGQVPLFLLLDSITDVRNVGAIARTALCFGVHALIIPQTGAALIQEDAIKASAGALEKIMICKFSSLMQAIDILQLNGILLYATVLPQKTTLSLHEVALDIPLAIVIGSEDKGISPAIIKKCNEKITIPIQDEFDSLNVSVATAITLYEIHKNRKLIVK